MFQKIFQNPQQVYILAILIVALLVSAGGVIFLRLKKPAEPKPPKVAQATGAAPRTQSFLSEKIRELWLTTKNFDDELLQSLEEVLYTSDLGPKAVEKLLHGVREKLPRGDLSQLDKVKSVLNADISLILNKSKTQVSLHHPEVILIVGVNGVGKTTSIGKLARYYTKQGKKVLLIAGDTFRAAAVEQLKTWAVRSGAEFYSTVQTQDPAAVCFQGLEKAVSEKADVVIIDTAGRLHNQENLMEEMKKIRRVIQKVISDGPHMALLVVDATTGQNALQQAKQFNEAVGLTGLIVTKLDSTAKGGVIVGIAEEVGIIPEFVGSGEKIDDLSVFSAEKFTHQLLD